MDRTEIAAQIVENAGDAVVCADDEGKIVLWNAGAEDVFGYDASEAVGESLDLIVPERFRERHWEGYDAAMERGESTYGRGDLLSVPAVRADGERISIEFTVTMVRSGEGEVIGIGAIVRDVTDRWEEEQARADRIEALEARIAELEGDA